jgi:hypothetical protein
MLAAEPGHRVLVVVEVTFDFEELQDTINTVVTMNKTIRSKGFIDFFMVGRYGFAIKEPMNEGMFAPRYN